MPAVVKQKAQLCELGFLHPIVLMKGIEALFY